MSIIRLLFRAFFPSKRVVFPNVHVFFGHLRSPALLSPPIPGRPLFRIILSP